MQAALDIVGKQVDCHSIAAALRYDKVGIALRRLYILAMHRFEYILIAVDHYLGRTASLYAVAGDNTDKTVVRPSTKTLISSILRIVGSVSTNMPSTITTSDGFTSTVSSWRSAGKIRICGTDVLRLEQLQVLYKK